MLSRLCSEPTPFDESFQAPARQAEGWLGPCRFVALFSCPGVHTFTQFGRKTDGRYGIMPGGATAFLCTRGHMLPFLFHLYHLPTQRRSSIPAKEGDGDPRHSRSVCPMGCSCPMCRTRLPTPSTAVSQSDLSEWPEARASARSARTS